MTISDIEKEMPKTVTVPIAAEIMGITPVLLRSLLVENKLPFGAAVKMTQTESYINTVRFIKYMKGE